MADKSSGSTPSSETVPPPADTDSDTPATSDLNPHQKRRDRLYPTQEDDYGYTFFPKRLQPEKKSFVRRMWDKSWDNKYQAKVMTCQMNVAWCINNGPIFGTRVGNYELVYLAGADVKSAVDPTVKLMMRALKSKGCEVDLKRHIVCEPCTHGVNGGWDSQVHQVVVCHNNSSNQGVCCNVLAHELLHAFDFCRAKVDFNNMEHLACTEIRAANQQHCSYLAAFAGGDAGLFNIRGRHQECVKKKAMQSIIMVRNQSTEDARAVIDKVFERCYNDHEPMGCIPRKYTMDRQRALYEGLDFGYLP